MSRAPWHRRGGFLEGMARGVVAGYLVALVALTVLGLGAGCSSCAHGATLTIRGTAPGFDNAGTCAAPSLTPAAGAALVTVHVSVTGPAAFADSLQVAAGAAFAFTRTAPAGTYTVRAWASDAGGAGCDTTLSVTVKNPPWRVRL